MSGKFVFIESNTTGTGALLIEKTNQQGLTPILLTRDPDRYTFLPKSDLVLVVLDTRDYDCLLAYVKSQSGIVGVFSSSEYFIQIASQIAAVLGLPHGNPEAIATCRSKWALSQKQTAVNLPSIKTVTADQFLLSQTPGSNTQFPVVVKPDNGSGSVGVRRCDSLQAACEHIQLLKATSESTILVQSWVSGDEYSAEIYTVDGQHTLLGVTKKYVEGGPYFIETGHDFPAAIANDVLVRAKQHIFYLLDQLTYNFGFTHVEFKVINDEIIVVEVNPRLAGGMIPCLIEAATGVDVLSLLINLYIGNRPIVDVSIQQYASIRHVWSKVSGVVTELTVSQVAAESDIVFVKKVGDQLVSTTDFRARLAYSIQTGKTLAASQQRANNAIDQVHFHVEETHG